MLFVELGTAEKKLLWNMAQQIMNNNSYGYVKVRCDWVKKKNKQYFFQLNCLDNF